MSEQERFSDGDWETLLFAPNWMGMYVAFADGKPRDEELQAMLKSFTEVVESPSALILEVILDLVTRIDTVLPAYAKDPRSFVEGLRDVGRVLDANVSAREATLFKEALLKIGEKVAHASGGPFRKVSKDEKKRLATAGSLLGL